MLKFLDVAPHLENLPPAATADKYSGKKQQQQKVIKFRRLSDRDVT